MLCVRTVRCTYDQIAAIFVVIKFREVIHDIRGSVASIPLYAPSHIKMCSDKRTMLK